MLMTLAWVALGFISPGYTMWGAHIAPSSAISQPVGGRGLGPTAPFMNAACVISGAQVIVGGVGIPSCSRCQEWGGMIDGFFTLEHFIGFALALTTLLRYPVVGLFLSRLPRWRRLGSWLIAGGPLMLALAAVYFATFTPTVEGVQQGVPA